MAAVVKAVGILRPGGNAPAACGRERRLRGRLEAGLPAPREPRPAPHHQVVLGLVTTKDGRLEDPEDIVARVEEATRYVPLDRLALSPQCVSASGEIARTMTLEEQEAKLRLVGDTARRVWG